MRKLCKKILLPLSPGFCSKQSFLRFSKLKHGGLMAQMKHCALWDGAFWDKKKNEFLVIF